MVVPSDESTNIFVNMETESEGRCFLQPNTSKLKFMPKKPKTKNQKKEKMKKKPFKSISKGGKQKQSN